MAPILAAAPIDTIAQVDREALFVAPADGALAIFLSQDLSLTAVDGKVFRPEDFDGSGDEEFAKLQGTLEQWVATTAAPRLTLRTCSQSPTGRQGRQ